MAQHENGHRRHVESVSRPTDTESVSDAVVRAVAQLSETDPTEVEPLYDHIDPDALNGLFGSGSAPLAVEFRHDDHRVRIEGHDNVSVEVVAPDSAERAP